MVRLRHDRSHLPQSHIEESTRMTCPRVFLLYDPKQKGRARTERALGFLVPCT
jgi:hypothetical protein